VAPRGARSSSCPGYLWLNALSILLLSSISAVRAGVAPPAHPCRRRFKPLARKRRVGDGRARFEKMQGAEMLSTPRQQPQRQLSTPSAPAAAHRLRAHRTIFSAALRSAQKKSGAAEQQRAATYSAALGRLVQQMDELQARIDKLIDTDRQR
jgi:hypothetical protein